MTSPPDDYFSWWSYEPLVAPKVEAVDPEDIVPTTGPRQTDVWLTEWQVADDGIDVAVGEQVDWNLVAMDQQWAARLFGGRRRISLELDTYADATLDVNNPVLWNAVSGRIIRIDQVSVRYHPSEDPADHGSRVPETGGAMQHSVPSLWKRRAHHGELVGWIVRIQG